MTMNFEEYDRESRCEICRAPFALAPASQFDRSRSACSKNISSLIEDTHPEIEAKAAAETRQMEQRADDMSLFSRNQIVNALRRYELEYQTSMKSFWPSVAIGSIQTLIVGFVLATVVDLRLAFLFAFSLYLLLSLLFFVLLRKRLFARFEGAAERLHALSGLPLAEFQSKLESLNTRFPRAFHVFQKQVCENQSGGSFVSGTDFVPLLGLDAGHQSQSR